MYYVYMAKNKGNNLYVGVTQDPIRRIYYHNHKRGSIFTKNNPSFEIVFLEGQETLTEARRREIQIKKWRRDKKEELILRYSKGLETKI